MKREYIAATILVSIIGLTYIISRLPDVVLIVLAGLVCGVSLCIPGMILMSIWVYSADNRRPNVSSNYYYYPPMIEPPSIVPYQPIRSDYVPGEFTVIGEDK